ncbi:potassium channel family protein [Kribbella sp. CA-247076]|uniref:potassium channel family protein n=1 Tax=Kribbella sp. CA-247076 TaxID=3239941 RepID=UPI003D8DC187
MHETTSRWRRPIISFAGLVVAYYAVPSGIASDAGFVLGMLSTTAAVAVLGWAIAGQVRRQLRGDEDVALPSLVILLELVVVVFAYGFYALEQSRPGQVVGLETRTDALYFTVTTMTTVGYGDVHADGQVARVMVLVQMAFNLVFVGALVSVVSGQVRRRATRRGSPGPDDDGPPRRTHGDR